VSDRVARQLERQSAPVPRLALSKLEAAQSIASSVDYLEEHVLPSLRVVRRGRKVLIPVKELERWLEREAALTIEATR
jgi:hypothetical protein